MLMVFIILVHTSVVSGQDLWQWTSDECRQSTDRLKDLEQRATGQH